MGAGRRKTKIADAKRKPRKQAKRSKPKRKTGAPVGRPRKFVDFEMVRLLAGYGMVEEQIASKVGLSVRTLQRNKADDPEFAEMWTRAVSGGTGDFESDVFVSLHKSVKRRDKGALLWALDYITRRYKEGPLEKPLLLELPLSNGSVLLVPEGLDPIAAVEHAENVFNLPEWEFPKRDHLEEV